MRLLNIRDNKPFIKKATYKRRTKEEIKENKKPEVIEKRIEYLQDWCFLNFNENGIWTIKINNEVQEGTSLKKIEQIFSKLRQLKKQKHRNLNLCRRLVIWTNNLVRFSDLIQALNGHRFEEFKTEHAFNTQTLWIWDDDFEFRNFNIISGGEAKKIKEIYNLKGNEVDIMENYIKLQEQSNWATFRYTAAHNFERLLEKRIKQNMDESEEKSYNLELYLRNKSEGNQLFNTWVRKACLSGALWIEPKMQRKALEWVSSFDISQAYGGQFVRANDFPLGTIIETSMPKSQVMQQKWYAFCFEFDSEPDAPFQWMQPFQKDKNDKDGLLKENKWYLFMEKTDIDCMKLMEAKFNVRPRIIHQFICDNPSKIGYLHPKVRKTINDLYNERQELKVKGDRTEKIIKQINEVAYGKGLQKRESWHYFSPQISYHALAKTRYELLLMMTRIKEDLVAIDTDGIKTKYSKKKSIELFLERNEEIKKELAAAGFPDTKIGTWKFEGTYKKFIQYEKKVYAYEDEEGLHCKFAGCNLEQLKDFLIECRDMDGLLKCLSVPGGVVEKRIKFCDNDSYAVETIYRDYSLVKEELNAYFQRLKIVSQIA